MSVKIAAPDGLILSNVSYGAIPNIVNTAKYPNACIGSYIYRSIHRGTEAPFTGHIRTTIEPNSGAHYYVQSAYKTGFNSVSCTVNLGEATIFPKGKRRGFIALTMVTNGRRISQCDIGLACDTSDVNGKGSWYAASWCKDNDTGNNLVPQSCDGVDCDGGARRYFGANETVTITITVEHSSNYDKITGTYTGSRGTTAKIVYYSDLTENADNNFFVLEDGKPLLRFVRFMSFVPASGSPMEDDADFSSMVAKMENLKINGITWGVSNDHIEYAWPVQGANIEDLKIGTLTSGGTAGQDSISIIHRYQLH